MREQIVKLRKEGKTYNQIKKELGCSKSKIAYYLNNTTKQKTIDRTRKIRFKIRKELKDIYGSCCSICGYSKCLAALQFHHLNPKNKKFGINEALKSNIKVSKEEILEEIKKCILLCANCHFEIHCPDEKDF